MQPIFQDVVVEFEAVYLVPIQSLHTDSLAITTEIGDYNVEMVSVDTWCSIDIMFMDCFRKMKKTTKVKPVATSLFDFKGEVVRVAGKVSLTMVSGQGTWTKTRTITFILVDTTSQYNVMLGRPSLSLYVAIISPVHLMMKFSVEDEKD